MLESMPRCSRLCWLALTAIVVALQPAHAADPIPFRVGISAPVVTIFPVWMAQAEKAAADFY